MKGSFEVILFKATSQPKAEMNNYQLACKAYRKKWQKTTQAYVTWRLTIDNPSPNSEAPAVTREICGKLGTSTD